MDSARVTGPRHLRSILADNASPLTMAGTQTYLVGAARIAIIDPGPALQSHLDNITAAAGDSVVAAILVTHNHPDHADGAHALAGRLHTSVRAYEAHTLHDDDLIETDAGTLRALHTPGHRADHFAFHWEREYAVFCGDLMMGGQNTALVAPPEGNLRAYLRSLERIKELDARFIYPTHGAAFTEPGAAIEAYVQHRQDRLAQVLTAVAAGDNSLDALVAHIYGSALPPEYHDVLGGAVRAYLDHLVAQGKLRRDAAPGTERWARSEE